MDMIDGKTPAEWVHGLMAGDPASFKAGYSHASAVLAVKELFGLDDDETETLRQNTTEHV